MNRTTIAAAAVIAALTATTGTAAASPWPAGHLAPLPTACGTSPYCFSYTSGSGLKLASKAGYATEVQATTNASEAGLNDSAWYASGGPVHVFQLFRGGAPTGKYLNVSAAGQLVLGADPTVGFTFDGVANPDGTCTGTWAAPSGLVWTAGANGGPVSLRAPSGAANQDWTTAKPTA